MGNDTIVISVSKEDLDATGRVILEAGRWCKTFYADGPWRPRGKWIECNWSIRCSECGYSMPWVVRNFCPNCGADMREEKQDG